MTREERISWENRRDEYEGRIIDAARAAGRLAVVDCTDKKYPVPAAIRAELNRAADPDARESVYRSAALLRRKASSLRSLADVLDRDKKPKQALAIRAKADANEREADASEERVRP